MKKMNIVLAEAYIYTTIIISTNINYFRENLPLNLPQNIEINEHYKYKFHLYNFCKIEDRQGQFQLMLNGEWKGNYLNTDIILPYPFLITEKESIILLSKSNFKIGLIGYIRINLEKMT